MSSSRYVKDNSRPSLTDPGVILLRCKHCRDFKPHDREHFHTVGKNGQLRLVCKECVSAIKRDRSSQMERKGIFTLSPEVRQYHRNWYLLNQNTLAAKSREAQRVKLSTFLGQLENKRRQAMYRSRRRGLRFDLTLLDLVEQLESQEWRCAITGDEMTAIGGRGVIRSNMSIDRRNPSLGYTKENIQLVCYYANVAKTDMTEEELLEFCAKVLRNADIATGKEARMSA